MKKLLALVAFLAIFFSCSTPGDDSSKEILGKWDLVSITVDGQTIPVEGTGYSMSVTFDSNGITKIYEDGFLESESTYVIKGDVIIVNEDGAEESEVLIIKIEKLTSSTLVWNFVVDGQRTLFTFKR